jgi:hypothetical protein
MTSRYIERVFSKRMVFDKDRLVETVFYNKHQWKTSGGKALGKVEDLL